METLTGELMDGKARPELNSSSETNPTLSMPAFTIRTDGIISQVIHVFGLKMCLVIYLQKRIVDDLDNFLEDVMHEGTIPEEDMDEEHYMFAGEGTF